MIPRTELADLLQKRLGNYLTKEKLDELTAEILNLEAGWEEVDVSHKEMGYSMSINCSDICWLADQVDRGQVIRMYRKKPAAGGQ